MEGLEIWQKKDLKSLLWTSLPSGCISQGSSLLSSGSVMDAAGIKPLLPSVTSV